MVATTPLSERASDLISQSTDAHPTNAQPSLQRTDELNLSRENLSVGTNSVTPGFDGALELVRQELSQQVSLTQSLYAEQQPTPMGVQPTATVAAVPGDVRVAAQTTLLDLPPLNARDFLPVPAEQDNRQAFNPYANPQTPEQQQRFNWNSVSNQIIWAGAGRFTFDRACDDAAFNPLESIRGSRFSIPSEDIIAHPNLPLQGLLDGRVRLEPGLVVYSTDNGQRGEGGGRGVRAHFGTLYQDKSTGEWRVVDNVEKDWGLKEYVDYYSGSYGSKKINHLYYTGPAITQQLARIQGR